MKSSLTKLALTATLGLAITLTLNACEEKEKKATASESQPSGGECPYKEGPPITIEAVFLGNDEDDPEGLAYSKYRLTNGEQKMFNGFAPDDVKQGDKVSVTYIVIEDKNQSDVGCTTFNTIKSVKKIGGSATTLTDPRDSKTYKTAKIGNQTWMAENLNYEAKDSKCYDNKPDNCKKYGKLYNWETAKSACPKGWKLPNETDWNALMAAVGGQGTASKYLKATSGWNDFDGKSGNGEDKFGFSALPGGKGRSDGSFSRVGDSGNWWLTSNSNNDKDTYYWTMDYNDEFLYKAMESQLYYDDSTNEFNYNNRYFFSVRCLQN